MKSKLYLGGADLQSTIDIIKREKAKAATGMEINDTDTLANSTIKRKKRETIKSIQFDQNIQHRASRGNSVEYHMSLSEQLALENRPFGNYLKLHAPWHGSVLTDEEKAELHGKIFLILNDSFSDDLQVKHNNKNMKRNIDDKEKQEILDALNTYLNPQRNTKEDSFGDSSLKTVNIMEAKNDFSNGYNFRGINSLSSSNNAFHRSSSSHTDLYKEPLENDANKGRRQKRQSSDRKFREHFFLS